MIKHSHFRLSIFCDEAGLSEVREHLAVSESNELVEFGTDEELSDQQRNQLVFSHHWHLNSPVGIEGCPTTRLEALVRAIEPFGDRLGTLDERFPRYIDVVYNVTPQHPHGILGEFDMYCTPAKLMPQLAAWNLDVHYETIWFNHPDWKTPSSSWWKRLKSRWMSK